MQFGRGTRILSVIHGRDARAVSGATKVINQEFY